MSRMEQFLNATIQQIIELVAEETAVLKDRSAADLREFNLRKSRGLYDLSRALHQLSGSDLSAATLENLHTLRVSLQENHSALTLHLQAMREIADVVSAAICSADSDGTYSNPFNGSRART